MLQSLKTDLRKKPWNVSDAPAGSRGKLLNISTSSKKRTKPHSTRPQKFGVHERHLQRNPRIENLWRAPGHQCTCWAGEIWTRRNWTLFEYPELPQRLSQPMVKCERTRRQQYTSTIWIPPWQYKSSRIRKQFYRWENFAKITDIPMSDTVVKNHTFLKTAGQDCQLALPIRLPVHRQHR